jgi:hypothetical protein
MNSCVGEEGSESRIKLQRSDICYRELEQKARKGTCKGTPQASMLGSKSLEEQCLVNNLLWVIPFLGKFLPCSMTII